MNPTNKIRNFTWVLVAIVGISIALVAIFVFRVNPGLVLSYGLIFTMFFGHLFMHNGHSHNNIQQQDDTQSSLYIPPVKYSPVPVENDETHKQSHGCH